MRYRERGKAEGGIGRGELFSICLCLPLGGLVFSGWLPRCGGVGTLAAAILVGAAVWGGLALYIELFAGQSFGEAMEYALGRAMGRIVIFAYAVLWLLLAVLGAVYAVLLWQALGAAAVSRSIYLLLFLLTGAMFAAVGAEPLARVALLVAVPSLLLVLGNVWLTMRGADWGNLLPMSDSDFNSVKNGVWGGLLLFGSGAVLLPMAERIREVKRRRGTVAAAWAISAAVILALGLGMKVVLSVLVEEYHFPLLQVFRLAEVGDWFSRFEVIGAGLLVVILLMRSATLMSAAVDGLCYLWQVRERGMRYAVSAGAAVLLWAAAVICGRQCGDWWTMLTGSLSGLGWAMAAGGVAVPWGIVLCGMMNHKRERKTVIIRHK